MKKEISFWTRNQRFELAQHLQLEIAKIEFEELELPNFLIRVVPEIEFLSDPYLKPLKADIQGGWSIWLRETLCGVSFNYNDYLESLIHEIAHAIVDRIDKQMDHTDNDEIFKMRHREIKKKAKIIWPKKEVPTEVRHLFEIDNAKERIIYLMKELQKVDDKLFDDFKEVL